MVKNYFRPGNKTNHDKQTKHGFSSIKNRHPLYNMWLNIKSRCYSKHAQSNDVREIKNLFLEGKRNFEIAKQFNVMPGCISMIRCKVTWKHVI